MRTTVKVGASVWQNSCSRAALLYNASEQPNAARCGEQAACTSVGVDSGALICHAAKCCHLALLAVKPCHCVDARLNLADPESDADAHLLGALQVDREGDEHAVALQVGDAALESGIPHVYFRPAAQQPGPT